MKKTVFEKKYPLFTSYFIDQNIQDNMLDNSDLLRKYNEYNAIIASFIQELESYFNHDIIRNIIIETIIKYPDEMLISIIKAYFASEESVKANIDFIKYYNLTSNFGGDSVKYIEKHGIIVNRKYKDIPNLVIDEKYKEIKTGEESFKNEKLDDVYDKLTYSERKYVVDLLTNNLYTKLNVIFGELKFNLVTLIRVLTYKGIDTDLLNEKLLTGIGTYYTMVLFCLLFDIDNTFKIIDILKRIAADNRFNLIKEIINFNYLTALNNITYDELTDKNDEDALKLLSEKGLILKVQQN